MFVSYKASIDGLTIIDDDWKQDVYLTGWEAIVAPYKQRGLPVAPNLCRAMIYFYTERHITMNAMNVADAIRQTLNNDPACVPYKDEIEKYLTLL